MEKTAVHGTAVFDMHSIPTVHLDHKSEIAVPGQGHGYLLTIKMT